MTKHTPAPWTQAELAPTEIVANGDTMIATARDGLNGISREEAIANARLIAAAPELLELLKKSQRLGLDFSIGSAYISRAYIDAQEELNARINA